MEQEKEILSPKEISENTKKTLKRYISVIAAAGAMTGVTGISTAFFVAKAKDDRTRKIILGTGLAGIAAEAILVGIAIRKMDGYIDNHDDTVKLDIIHQFLETKTEEEKVILIDKLMNELLENLDD